MSPESLSTGLADRGVQMSYNADGLKFWPKQHVSDEDLKWLKTLKSEVIFYLKGYSTIEKGTKFETEYGSYSASQVYGANSRVSGHASESKDLTLFFDFSEIASQSQIDFLRKRCGAIEKRVHSLPDGKLNQEFSNFEFEWRFIYTELNRQMRLLKSKQGSV